MCIIPALKMPSRRGHQCSHRRDEASFLPRFCSAVSMKTFAVPLAQSKFSAHMEFGLQVSVANPNFARKVICKVPQHRHNSMIDMEPYSPDLQDSQGSTSHDDEARDPSSFSEGSSVVRRLVKAETQGIQVWKLATSTALFLTAVAVVASTYFFMIRQEYNKFKATVRA